MKKIRDGQSRQSQGRRRPRRDPGSRRAIDLSAALLARHNPIEQAFAKQKAHLCQACPRTMAATECANYFEHAQYASM
jgi:hypothetical protein